jgi:hypothetical protein
MSNLKKKRVLWGPFAGATMYLDPSISKRKLLGVYEYVLNGWLKEKISKHSNYVDVGANNGYHTFGFAYAAMKAGHKPKVIAIEPGHVEELSLPLTWPAYKGCDITIMQKYCSDRTEGNHISLHDALGDMETALIKIDIEGAEERVMSVAGDLVGNPGFDWCIEIHSDQRIPIIAKYFCDAGRPFLIKDMGPLPIIGPEHRPLHTTWLLTI